MGSLKKLLKIAGIIIVSIILLMILLVVGAKIFEDDLASLTMERLETEIDAPMSIGKVSLIPLFSFPQFSAEINKLYIGDPKSPNSDTLFYINSLKLGLNSWDLINGVYTIDKLEISGLDFDYTIDKQGKSNIDFLINSFADTGTDTIEDTASTNLDLSAEKFKLENIHVSYYDSLTNTGSHITIPEITIKATTKNNKYKGSTDGSFILSQCQFEDTKLAKMESCNVSFDLKFVDDELIIKKLSIGSEGIDLGMEGVFNNKDGYGINAIIEANTLDFNILKKYIPEQQMKLIDDIELAQMDPISLDLNMLYKDNNIDIYKLLLKSKGFDLGVNGSLINADTLTIDANIETLKLDFNLLKKYVPLKYLQEYGIIDVGGIVDVSAKISGDYADSTLMPMVDAKINFRNLSVQTIDYPQIDTFNLAAQITTGEESDFSKASIRIANAEIMSPKSSFQLEGTVIGMENSKYNIQSDIDINLAEFDQLIPDSLANNMEGNIKALISTSGTLPENMDHLVDYLMDHSTVSLDFKEVSALLNDSLKVDEFSTIIRYSPLETNVKEFQIEMLSLKSEALNINIHNTSLSSMIIGNINDPENAGLKLNAFNIENGDSRITGSGEVNNFNTPDFDIKTSISIHLEEFISFMPDSLINAMSGTAKADIESHGRINLDSLDSQLLPILFENSSFDFTCDNISLAFGDSLMDVDSVSGHMGLKNDLLDINTFSAIYNGFKMEMDSCKIRNLYKAVLLNQKEELYVNTYIKCSDFIFDDFKHLMAFDEEETETVVNPENTSNDTSIIEPRNWTYLIHGSASVNSIIIDSLHLDDFNINRLHINDMSSLFKLTDSSSIFDQFKLKMFEGEMNNSIHYKVRKDGTQSVSTHNIISNMNMRTMLSDMDNFGMDSLITYDNISGLLSLDLNTFVPIDDSVRMDKMMVSGDITLEKGGVYNFPPAQEISSFTSIKELDNIQFKTLRSNIFMFKNKLYVPRTNIVSNAIDIAAFGMQSLDGDSEYHMEIHLSNILFGKSKRRNKKQDKSGEEIDKESLKKSSRKVRYTVVEGKSKAGLDNKDDREDMMNKIRVQKKMLDFIFFPKNIHYNTDTNITPK